ncbi:MAG: hypothetical protein KC457_31340, partial [Myxococcales bacterium]|nr:hypothetical protein [Myxococcales bacterium]
EHVRFVTTRTELSARSPGPVRFNELIRLLKWWAAIQAANEEILPTPSFLLEILAARVFDRFGVAETYTDTLVTTYAALAEIVGERQTVDFSGDGGDPTRVGWRVLDPVNGDNSVVPVTWTEADIDRLARACESGRQIMDRVRELDGRRRGREVLETLRELFGPALGRLGLEDGEWGTEGWSQWSTRS